MRVLILFDQLGDEARQDELDVLDQVAVVRTALAELGHEVLELAFGLDLGASAEALVRLRPDVVFNLVESVARRGSLIHLAPALLDTLGIAYTGSRTEAVFVTSGKLLSKRLLRLSGLPTPDWCSLGETCVSAGTPRGTYIVKSAWEHGSIGLDDESLVDAGTTDLQAAIRRAAPDLGGLAFAEQFVDGREFNIALLAGPDGPQVLPPAEIEFAGDWSGRARIVGYDAKWAAGSFVYEGTPRTFEFAEQDGPLLAELARLSLACWELFGLRGHVRVDFRVDAGGRPFVLEVNTNPCLSPDAGYAAALARAGLSSRQAVARLLADALA